MTLFLMNDEDVFSRFQFVCHFDCSAELGNVRFVSRISIMKGLLNKYQMLLVLFCILGPHSQHMRFPG